MRKLLNFAALLALALAPAHAQAQGGGDGRLLEQAPLALPAYEQLPERFRRLYTREAVERVRGASDLELLRVRYTSDGLNIVELARTLPYVDTERLFMVGFSRGAMMTLQAVRRAVDKLARDFNARDAKAVMSNFAADVVLVSPGRADVDYKAMDEGFARAYANPQAPPYRVVTKVEEVGVSGDMAFVRLLWLVERDSDGKTLSRHKDLEVWRRRPDGSWRLYRGLSFHLPAG